MIARRILPIDEWLLRGSVDWMGGIGWQMSYGQEGDLMVIKAGLYRVLPPSLEPRFDETVLWEMLILLWWNDVICVQYDDIILGNFSIFGDEEKKIKIRRFAAPGRQQFNRQNKCGLAWQKERFACTKRKSFRSSSGDSKCMQTRLCTSDSVEYIMIPSWNPKSKWCTYIHTYEQLGKFLHDLHRAWEHSCCCCIQQEWH